LNKGGGLRAGWTEAKGNYKAELVLLACLFECQQRLIFKIFFLFLILIYQNKIYLNYFKNKF
jgi:hypothetical protein